MGNVVELRVGVVDNDRALAEVGPNEVIDVFVDCSGKGGSAALTQSETNATEGVGLLQVAEVALSQVTSLLNRAITLATEASNGTLNSDPGERGQPGVSIDPGRNRNIGSTTTYNQEQVFDGNTDRDLYRGLSTAGASVDDLNIHPLSESSVGDTGGAMAYSNGSNP